MNRAIVKIPITEALETDAWYNMATTPPAVGEVIMVRSSSSGVTFPPYRMRVARVDFSKDNVIVGPTVHPDDTEGGVFTEKQITRTKVKNRWWRYA